MEDDEGRDYETRETSPKAAKANHWQGRNATAGPATGVNQLRPVARGGLIITAATTTTRTTRLDLGAKIH